MSNSRLSQPQTVALPRPDCKPYNMPKNGFISPGSVASNSFKLENSIEFDILEGASSLAHFGMDIGGTLCKVVYFEPTKASCSSDMNEVVGSNEDDIPKVVQSRIIVDENPNEDGHSEPVSCEGKETYRKTGAFGAESIIRTEIQKDSHLDVMSGSGNLCDQLKGSDDQHSNEEDERHGNCSQGYLNFNSTTTSLDVLTRELPKEVTASSSYPTSNIRKIWLSSHVPIDLPGYGALHFKCFETWRIEEFLTLTREHSLVSPGRAIGATGGGARKFFDKFLNVAGLQLQHYDELKSLVRGIDFLVRNAQHESFEYPIGTYKAGLIQRPWKSPENNSDDDDNNLLLREKGGQHAGDENGSGKCDGGIKPRTIEDTPIPRIDGDFVLLDGRKNLYPYLVVNIGSGVGILRVDSPDKFQRVGGSSLGGSTFLGLTSALTGCNSFEEAVNLAMRGDSTQIDMLVGDIYGGDYLEMGLAATTVASSFGKLVEPAKRDAAMKTPEHLAKAILLMITNNIGSLAMLHARAAGVDRVLFTGSFLRGNKVATRLLAVAMEFWSKGLIKAIFLRHEGHAGAVGAMLYALDPTLKDGSILLL